MSRKQRDGRGMQPPGSLDLQRGNHQPAQPATVRQERHELQAKFHQGPLPAPEDLAAYNQVFPGCAERIVALAETQAAHRQRMESISIGGNSKREARGQWMAFTLCLLVVLAGALAVWLGKPLAGLTALLTPLAGIAALFLVKRRDERSAIREKVAAEQRAARP